MTNEERQAKRYLFAGAVTDLVLAMLAGDLPVSKRPHEKAMREIAERCACFGLTTGIEIATAVAAAFDTVTRIDEHIANPDPMARAALAVAQAASAAVN